MCSLGLIKNWQIEDLVWNNFKLSEILYALLKQKQKLTLGSKFEIDVKYFDNNLNFFNFFNGWICLQEITFPFSHDHDQGHVFYQNTKNSQNFLIILNFFRTKNRGQKCKISILHSILFLCHSSYLRISFIPVLTANFWRGTKKFKIFFCRFLDAKCHPQRYGQNPFFSMMIKFSEKGIYCKKMIFWAHAKIVKWP